MSYATASLVEDARQSPGTLMCSLKINERTGHFLLVLINVKLIQVVIVVILIKIFNRVLRAADPDPLCSAMQQLPSHQSEPSSCTQYR